MTSCVREPPVVSTALAPSPSLKARGTMPGEAYATCRPPPQRLAARDVLVHAARAVSKVAQRGSIPAHLLVTRVAQVRVLPCVDAAYDTIVRVIRQAEHEVLMQNYVWEDGTRGARAVVDAIQARCADVASGLRPPWQLRIVLHHRGRYALPTACKFLSRELEHFIQSLDPRHVQAELAYADNHTIGADILHSKNVIADGREVLFVGTNFEKHNDQPDNWYDNGVHMTGQTAHAARADWCHVRAHRHTRLCVSNASMAPVMAALPAGLHGGRQAPVLVVSHLARSWPWWSPKCESNPQAQGVLALLNHACRSIDIITPCLNVPHVRRAIIEAVLRGVVVRYVTCLNMDRVLQHWFRGGNNADSAQILLQEVLKRGGSKAARRLHIAWSSFDGATIPPQKTLGTSHAKNICIDGHVLMVGSMNLDWQSWNNSRELSCIVDDARAASQWHSEVFDKRWAAAVPMRAQDLPCHYRHRFSRAYRYLKK